MNEVDPVAVRATLEAWLHRRRALIEQTMWHLRFLTPWACLEHCMGGHESLAKAAQLVRNHAEQLELPAEFYDLEAPPSNEEKDRPLYNVAAWFFEALTKQDAELGRHYVEQDF